MEPSTKTLPPEIPSDALRAPEPTPHADIGMVLGSYRVLEVLGEGGMGLVYLAEHIRLGRKVAIKRLKDRLAAKPESVKQFFEEARAVNRINHPHIVDITDFVVEENAAYYLMEYLQGETLADLIRREKVLPPRRAVHIVTQVCRALEAAHGAGFVHLDIKPSNIFLIDKNGDPDTVKLLDFGTAQLTQTLGSSSPSQSLRKSGMFTLGTPVYMSPEQASGDEVDIRSDLYSLGAVLYEALAGQPPFVAQSAPEYIYKHMSVTPKRVTQVKGIPYKIPRHCAKAVMACLEKDPAARPQSASDLAELLQRGNTITQGQVAPGLPGVAAPGGARRWTVVGVALAALVALVVGGVLLLGARGDSSDPLHPAGLSSAVAAGELILEQRAARPEHVMLLVKTTPPMAQVSLLSPERRPLGMTPLLYKAKRTEAKWKIVITADGHRPRILALVLDRDRTFEIALEKLPTAPEEVLREAEKSAAEDRAAKAAEKKKRRRSRRREAPKKVDEKKKPKEKPMVKRGRRKVDAVRTIDPFE